MKHNKRSISGSLACLLIVLSGSQASAQIHSPNLPENKWLHLAEEQFMQGHYENAAQSASNYIRFNAGNIYSRKNYALDKAKFYLVVAGLKQEKDGSVDSAVAYIGETANPAYRQRAAYALAQYHFRNNQLAAAVPYYEMAGISNLTNAEIANAKFELAYAYFTLRQFEKAEPLFASIRQLPNKYTSAGHYYFGLLAYNQGNYPQALESFEKIDNEKQYSAVVPYYIAEIYYFTGNRKKALDEALRLMKRPEKSYYDNELHLLAAQVLFEEQRYGDALPYFEHYYDNVSKIRKEDLYEMAYSYYRVNEWQNAIEKFKPLSNTRDSLGQTAMYLLGDSYLKTGDRKSARNAFSIAADMEFNPGQQEASQLLAAKLSYEMGYFDEAVTYINALLSGFPNTQYRDEARTMLSALLIKTSNYADAYNALAQVSNRDKTYWLTHQKVAYGYAMQKLQEGDAVEADNLLTESLKQPTDKAYEAVANFWKAELAYKAGRYDEALKYALSYVNESDVRDRAQYLSQSATPHNAYITLGYSAMGLKDFGAARDYFAKAQKAEADDMITMYNAMLREADAVFMQKDYAQALNLYDKIIDAGAEGADYARFQKAKLLGLQNKHDEKAALLQSLIAPPSSYTADARYELALTYIEQNKYQAAITTLQPLTSSEAKNLASKAWMKIGFVHQQLNEEEKAIAAFKEIVSNYPSSDERSAALDALRSLYIESNQPSAYAQLLKDNNISATDDASLDSTFYSAAEAQYASGKYSNSKQSFAQYLQQYPNGIFASKAHYYKGESHYQLKEYKEALAEYDIVLSGQWNDFTETSARKAATIAFKEKDYTAAARYYEAFRTSALNKENLQQAYSGLMQTNYNLGNFDAAANYADTLSAMPGLEENTLHNVLLVKARSLQRFNKNDDALEVYRQLEGSKTAAIAAEARYQIAAAYLQQGKITDAEKAASNAIKLSAGQDYWIVKSYILLADVLTGQKDYFNAKATLQSIVKNTKIPELKKEASEKLEQVKKLEKQQSKLSEE
jgi:tetratricopeptide (TPR) repeat protein